MLSRPDDIHLTIVKPLAGAIKKNWSSPLVMAIHRGGVNLVTGTSLTSTLYKVMEELIQGDICQYLADHLKH